MHNINVDRINKTADFVINDEHEKELIDRGIAELIRKQELKTVRRSSRDIIPPLEIEKLERYKKLTDFIKVGAVRLPIHQMLDLENALNEGIVKYEKEVTDNPNDDALVEMKSFLNLVHQISRSDVLNR